MAAPDVVDEYDQAIPHVRDTVRAASRAAVNAVRLQGEGASRETGILSRTGCIAEPNKVNQYVH